MGHSSARQGYLPLLRSRRFAPFFISQILTNLGDGLLSVSVIYYAIKMGASTGFLGAVVFAITLTRGLLGPLGGGLSDLLDRRRYVITLEVLRTLCVLLVPLLYQAGLLTLPLLAVMGVVISTLFAISVPAAKTVIMELVEKEELQRANGLIQTITWPAFFLGSGLLALMQDRVSPAGLFLVIGIMFAVSSLLLWQLPKNLTPPAPRRLTLSLFMQELKLGYQVLEVDKVMRARILLYAVFTFFWRGSLQICIPLLVLRHLNSPHWVYGSLMFANGVAEFLANLYVGKRHLFRPLVFTYLCEILLGAGLVLLAASLWLPFTLVWLFVSVILIGFAAATIDIPLMTVIQKQVDGAHIGKVVSYWFTLGSCGGAAGSLMFGLLFDVMPVLEGILLSGLACLLIGVLCYLWAAQRNRYTEEPG
jgi:MFS family permease